MEITELRIGNYIIQRGEFTSVESIERNLDDWDRINNIRALDCNGVEITKDWLIKLGFKLNGTYWFKDDNTFRFALMDNGLHCSIGDDERGFLYNVLSYVHELQNLYFALNNEELI